MRIDVEVPTTLSDLDFYAQIGAFVSFELIHIVIILLGGIALFLFGMQLMGDGLKKVAGGKLEVILYRLSNTPLKGVQVLRQLSSHRRQLLLWLLVLLMPV
mgnify:CR=1 FL=1